jgi:hypothetical protein
MSSTPASKAASLVFRIASTRQTDNGQAHAAHGFVSQQRHDLRTVEIHVEDREMWLPLA